MHILFTILYFILMIVLVVLGIAALKTYVFDKIRINKYIPLAASIVIIVLDYIFRDCGRIYTSIMSLIAIYLFSWFFDIQQTGGPKKEKKIVIKPKAKPNRVKNANKK